MKTQVEFITGRKIGEDVMVGEMLGALSAT